MSIHAVPHVPTARAEAALPTEDAFRVSTARRLLDVVVALLLLVVSAPVLLAVALLILMEDGRPLFYVQVRIGEHGVPFRLLKLRTMRTGTGGAEVTTAGDPRITRIGRVVRRLSLDELPQLWHVLRGQMTLVGPRPESRALAERYPASCRSVLDARPGLTGPTQLRFRERSTVPPAGGPGVEEWYLTRLVPQRVQADLEFLRRPSVLATARWLCMTALFVVGLVDLQVPAQRAPEG